MLISITTELSQTLFDLSCISFIRSWTPLIRAVNNQLLVLLLLFTVIIIIIIIIKFTVAESIHKALASCPPVAV